MQPSNGAPSDFASAKVATPLEVRDALMGLGIFEECGEPVSVSDGAVSYLKCYIDDPGIGDEGSTYRRGVAVLIFRSGSASDDCATVPPRGLPNGYEVVTDNDTFVALGEMNDAGRDNTWKWPEEVWPEDVARALGGTVVPVQVWCPGA